MENVSSCKLKKFTWRFCPSTYFGVFRLDFQILYKCMFAWLLFINSFSVLFFYKTSNKKIKNKVNERWGNAIISISSVAICIPKNPSIWPFVKIEQWLCPKKWTLRPFLNWTKIFRTEKDSSYLFFWRLKDWGHTGPVAEIFSIIPKNQHTVLLLWMRRAKVIFRWKIIGGVFRSFFIINKHDPCTMFCSWCTSM